MLNLKQGEMIDFNLDAFLACANEFVRSDEIERALWLLDNLPGFYRAHPPESVLQLKRDILERIAMPSTYIANPHDEAIDTDDRNQTSQTLRAQLIMIDVQWMNEEGVKPHIVDYGPGEYWLPYLLKSKGLKFTYQPIYLHDGAFKKAKDGLLEYLSTGAAPDQPVIFLACEIMEHLWNEADMKSEMLRSIGMADVVHVSTPRYTHGNYCKDWRKDKGELGHLRTYTTNEFYQLLLKIFPEYHLKLFDSYILHMRLVKKETFHEKIAALAIKKLESVEISQD